MYKQITGIFLLVFFVACIKIQPLELVDIQSVKMLGVSAQSISMAVGVKVKNPNKMKFVIKDHDIQVFVNDIDFGKAVYEENIIIPKLSEQVYHFKVNLDLSQALLGALSLTQAITSGKPVKVKLKGTMKVAAKGITKKVDVDEEKELKLVN